jgi:AraC-like DNA-binding protein
LPYPTRPTVTSRFALALLDEALRQGVAVSAELQAALKSGPRVAMTDQDAFWAVFCAARPSPLAALRLGLSVQAGHLDIVGLLLLSCETLGDAVDVLTEYAPIVGEQARFEAVRHGDDVTLQYWPEYQACRAQRVEAALGCTVNLARWMTSNAFRPKQVLLMHPAAADPAVYAEELGCPVRFGAAVNGIVMDAAALAQPLIHAGADVHAHLRGLADEMLASLERDSLPAKVKDLIRAHPRWGKERIADAIGLSGRHLNRKLGDEALSFKTLRETVLFETAREALKGREPTAAVAARLGFSDENAFSRAFVRWSGQTPAQYARALSARPSLASAPGSPVDVQ